ncbi:MAG: uncharacterized protein KVP18_004286 [Porospora cf. gigantea A]|uniref:uncharacterized protein n=1 Tax=Porospora cf. gigantea A TaxID=2853593 RepID=UPI00355AA040|nr:MAG: hypothetical protein KVP18_004286 [Porospora cf. gigantea A]
MRPVVLWWWLLIHSGLSQDDAADSGQQPLTEKEEVAKKAEARMATTFVKLMDLLQKYENILGKLDEIPKGV